MFKKIKDFVSNRKTALLGVFLGILCLVAIFLPDYLQRRRYDSVVTADGITYDFSDEVYVDSSVSSQVIIRDSSNDISLENNLEDDYTLIYSDLFKNFNKSDFLSSSFVDDSFSFSSELEDIFNYLSKYSNFNLITIDKDKLIYTDSSNSITINITTSDNKITDLSIDSTLDISYFSAANLSIQRAINNGAIYSWDSESSDLDNTIYLDPEFRIYYINIGDNFIITSSDLVYAYRAGEFSYDDFVSQSQALGLTYQSVTGNEVNEVSTEEVEKVSSEEVEN